MLKTVIDIKGNKRFKNLHEIEHHEKSFQDNMLTMDPARDLSTEKAREEFRKMTTKTSYRAQFGEPPKAAEDYVIMKQKPFR